MASVFSLLDKRIRSLLEDRGIKRPTEIQRKAIPVILKGEHVLLIAPTGLGKTEAALLPVFNQFLRNRSGKKGVSIVYVTPLRALNRDLLDRLEWWCTRLDLKLAVRHGDTEQRERARQARSPPDVLITTPETLNAILLGRVMRRHLRAVRWVIIDELHEMVDCKRGSQLSLALERLRELLDHEPQVIGLSATVGSPEEAARFLVGNGRPVEVVRVPVARMMELKVLFPAATDEDRRLAEALYTHPEVAARLRVMRELIEAHESAIVFTNTRSIAEVLASRFRVWDLDLPISIHHGSLSKPSRVAAEKGLKHGELKALVATSSLELGIDIGRVELVIQYMSPRQVTRLVQRVGRAGHRLDRVAKGVIITMDSDDTLEALAIAHNALKEELEPVKIPYKPYDALAHQIAGLLLKRRRLTFQEIVEIFNKAYPYRDLTVEDVEKVLRYMHERFPRLAWVSFEDEVVLKPRRSKALFEYYFGNLSMIPEEKQYLVVDGTSDSAIGVLDEAFMAEYGKPGIKFIIRGSPWIITHVSSDKLYVKPVDDPTGAIPSWIGEEIPVPYEIAQEVGRIRGLVEHQLRNGKKPQEIVTALSKEYVADKETLTHFLKETVEQVEKGYPAPTDKRVLVEDWEEFIILHANFGSLTNRALAQLLGHMLSERTGYSVVVQHDPYRIFIQTMGAANADHVIKIFNELKETSEDAVRALLVRATVKTGIFKRRMIHVARRFGALKKWADFGSVSLRSLLKSFEGTAIYEEALKEVFTKDLDLENLLHVLNRIRKGEIEIIKIENHGTATPIARLGIERVSMKTDLIPPERMRRILIESTKARLLNEVRCFICTDCWSYIEMIRINELPQKIVCPKCGSTNIGLLNVEEEKARVLVEKKGEKLTKSEQKLREKAEKTARLIKVFGKPAAVALCARRIRLKEVEELLRKENTFTDTFFELIIEAERKALSRRFG